MKILSDIYKQESGLELVACCEKLELKSGDLSSLTTPWHINWYSLVLDCSFSCSAKLLCALLCSLLTVLSRF